MKATGIIRCIDELGRIGIPKEIRRVNKLAEGDPLELFVGEPGEIIFKKYAPNCLSAQLADLRDSFSRSDLSYSTSKRQAIIDQLNNVIQQMEKIE